MIKIFLGYLMPVWFTLLGIISENVLQITSQVYYATYGYVMGAICIMVIAFKGD